MRKILKYKLLVIPIVTFQLYFQSSPAMAEISNVLYFKDDCRLVIEDAHLSKSLLKSKKSVTAVKANVSSQCIYSQRTKYLVIARSWTTIAGKEYASKVGRSKNEVELACGV